MSGDLPGFLRHRLEEAARTLGPGQRLDYSRELPVCNDCGDFMAELVTWDEQVRQRCRRELVCIGCGALPERRRASADPTAATPHGWTQLGMAL